jgi:hypothetical protein
LERGEVTEVERAEVMEVERAEATEATDLKNGATESPETNGEGLVMNTDYPACRWRRAIRPGWRVGDPIPKITSGPTEPRPLVIFGIGSPTLARAKRAPSGRPQSRK